MEAKDRTVAPAEVCADILGNPSSLLPYSIEMFFFFYWMLLKDTESSHAPRV